MERHTFQYNTLNFSYLDSGGNGPILIALHAHWMEGVTFAPLAKALAPNWRVIALDQRGHGYSDHAATYTRTDYLQDLRALFIHLNLKQPAVLLGNSLGGLNAYYFAALYPNLVRALIIEDIGTEVEVDASFSLNWEGFFKTREDLVQAVGSHFLPCLENSFRETDNGWKLAFNPKLILSSVNYTLGSHWETWIGSKCPALILRGKESRLTTQSNYEQMTLERPNTHLEVLEGGHVIHLDNLDGFTKAVKVFLRRLEEMGAKS